MAAGSAGVAAAFRYPLGCLAVTIERRAPTYATATLDRKSPCWRYGVYITAIFHRVHGEWRLVLEARSNRCPPRSLPAAVRAQLAVCARPSRRQPG
jgi:H+/Cl- antiporter ClcA